MQEYHKSNQARTTNDWPELWLQFYRDEWFREKLEISARSVLRKSQLSSAWKNDVVQEALLEFARQLRRDQSLGYDSERGEFQTFISTIIYRCCQKGIMRIHNPNAPRPKSIDRIKDEPSIEPEKQIDSFIDLHECIDQLDEPVRTVARQLVDGKSVLEIAELTDRSSRTIYRRVEEATSRLRELLQSD